MSSSFEDIGLGVYESLDERHEEIVYQTAVGNISDFTRCQKSLFNATTTGAAVGGTSHRVLDGPDQNGHLW